MKVTHNDNREKVYYKVVFVEGKNLVSAICNKIKLKERCRPNEIKTLLKKKRIYTVNKWTKSKSRKYGLTIYENMADAIKLIENDFLAPNFKIFTCHAKNVRRPKVPIKVFNFWPRGTLMADEVKLLEENKGELNEPTNWFPFYEPTNRFPF